MSEPWIEEYWPVVNYQPFITICLTSCSRFDLLERTIISLVDNWDGPKPDGRNVTFNLHEDSDLRVPQHIESHIDGFVGGNYRITTGKMGQIRACDHLMQMVETEYVMWAEDDILFHTPGFIQQSLDILEKDPRVVTVWIRDKKDMNKHPIIPHVLKTPNGTRYQKLVTNYRKVWAGFSFYTGLRRKSDYDLIGSYSKFMGKNSLDSESNISMEYKRLGFHAVTLLSQHCSHLGQNRSLPK